MVYSSSFLGSVPDTGWHPRTEYEHRIYLRNQNLSLKTEERKTKTTRKDWNV